MRLTQKGITAGLVTDTQRIIQYEKRQQEIDRCCLVLESFSLSRYEWSK